MPESKEYEIKEKMMDIWQLAEQSYSEEKQVDTISYYKDFYFEGSNLAERDIFIAKIENSKDNTNTYAIYSGQTNSLIAMVDEQGRLNFMPEYIERLKQIEPRLAEMLFLQDIKFVLPEELKEEDRILTKREREYLLEGRQTSLVKNGKLTIEEDSVEKEKNERKNKEQTDKTSEEQKQEKIAKTKNLSAHNVLRVRENSNLYKDHPNIEPNLYFYRDNNGIVRAEYLDANGVSHPSKYFEPSTTSLRQETVSLGEDGDPVTKEVPYQVMKTKGLNNTDKDVRDVRISVKIDAYGYLDIEETRQGKNGKWLSHDIEVKGRNYNSHAVNVATSIKTGEAEPDKQTEAYEKAEEIGLEKDGIEYSEMYLMQHADEVIEHFIKEGYQKKEAVQIFDYMIGEEALSVEEAKARLNKEIGAKQRNDRGDDNELLERASGGRTPGDDAWERRVNRG